MTALPLHAGGSFATFTIAAGGAGTKTDFLPKARLLEIMSTRHDEELPGVSSALWSILPGTRNSS